MFTDDVVFALARHLEPRELGMLSLTCKAARVTEPVQRVCTDAALDLYTKRVHCVSDGVLTAYTKFGTRHIRIELNYVDSDGMLLMVPVYYNGTEYSFTQLARQFVDASGQPTGMTISNLWGMVLDGTALGVWMRDDGVGFTLVVERELGPLSLSLQVSDEVEGFD